MKFRQKFSKSKILLKQRQYRFALLSSLLMIPSSTWAMEPAPEDEKTQVSKLRRAIDEVNKVIPSERERGIAILGLTGAGKSTLFNYLLNVPLCATDDTRSFGFVINPTEQSFSKITCGFNSETTLPVIKDEYYDFAGFQATSGPEGRSGPVQDIVNAYSIYKLLNNTTNIKILLVASEGQIKERNDFIPVIRQLEGMFPSRDIGSGLCLVITHRRDIPSLERFKTVLAKKCEDVTDLTDPQKQITTFLSNPENTQIAFFDMPRDQGPISDNNKNDITMALSKTKYLSGLKPQISILEPSRLLIGKLAALTVEDITAVITSFNQGLYQSCAEFIKNTLSTTPKTAAEFRRIFKEFSTFLKDISTNTESFDGSIAKFQKVLKDLSPNLFSELSNILETLKFFELVKPTELPIRKNPSWGSLSRAHTYLGTLAKEPQEEIHGSFFILKGSIVGMSDLIRKKNTKHQVFDELDVYCKHSLLLDQNIQVPGINLALLSPRWFVVASKSISLKGADGPNHSLQTAASGGYDGAAGTNGLPGLPGQSGGHFYGKGDEFYNLSSLSINVSGGNGGNGQNGGNGARGSNGCDGNRDGVAKREECYRISQTLLQPDDKASDNIYEKGAKIIFTLGNQMFREVYENGTLGKPGGHAGAAGEGGYPGKQGSVCIEGIQSGYKEIVEKEEKGIDGTHGKPGEGGKNGAIYRGTYIAEYTAPATRGIIPYNEHAKAAVGISTAEAVVTAGGTAITLAEGLTALPAVGVGLGIKTLSSVISSHVSSYWEADVTIVPHPLNASQGHEAREFNKADQRKANNPINLEEKKRHFEKENSDDK